jgi:hypothetical protein
MSFNLYSILGVNTELDLEKSKIKILTNLKEAGVGSVAGNSVHFSSGAVAFIDIFEEHKELRAEVQANDEASRDEAQGILLTTLETFFGPRDQENGWNDITESVLANKAQDAAALAATEAANQIEGGE